MAAGRACRSLSQGLQQAVSQGVAMLPIKASCAMKGDRSSRVTRRGLSKSAERIRSGDEFPKTALCGSGPAILHIEIIASRDDPPLTASVQDR
jgi:uncharacterized protein (AIM24 family)